jgi:hypothetical protein
VALHDQVAREIAALYGFVESLAAACLPPPTSVAFTDASERFFQYISTLAECTKKYLASYPVAVDGSDEDFQETRRELTTIRSAWRELHQFIKPAAEADTLNQPGALVSAMLQRVRLLPKFEDADFAIFHTDTFDYLQANPILINEAAAGLASIVGASGLSAPILIGIPNSQGKSVFLNCLIAHEMGHYVAGKHFLRSFLIPEIEVALAGVLGDKYTKQDLEERSSSFNLLAKWAEELFCDLFAIQLIGPCYCFAYVELFDVVTILDKDGKVASKDLPPFYKYYPSHHFRVKHQAELLKKLDWWQHVKAIDSRYTKVMEELEKITNKQFEELETGDRKLLLKAFHNILPEISSHLGRIAGTLDPGAHQFGELWESLAQYLDNGVVPSSINVETRPGYFEKARPSPVTILNAAFRYYLERVEKLMSLIQDQDPSIAEKRVNWTNRLQSWTAKALEDVRLLEEAKPWP